MKHANAHPAAEGSDGLDALCARYGLGPPARRALEAVVERLSSDPHAPTAVRDPLLVVERHVADSLVGLEIDQVAAARSLADIGAGPGLPGIVLAAALPSCEVREVESNRRKCEFISSLSAAAGLGNVRVVCARAEDWTDGLGSNDVVVARALAPQPVVLEYAAPLLAVGGHLVEWRGRREHQQEAAAAAAAAELGLTLVELVRVEPFAGASDRHIHVFEKVGPTPARFPRRAGTAARRPLGASRAVPPRR